MEKLKSAGKRLRTHRLFQDPFILFLIITSLVVVTVFIIYPLFCILKTSIYYKGVFSLETFKSTLATSGFKVAFWNSMKLGFGSAITSTLVGFIFAYQEAVRTVSVGDPSARQARVDHILAVAYNKREYLWLWRFDPCADTGVFPGIGHDV